MDTPHFTLHDSPFPVPRSPFPISRCRAGFTLVEMLAVIVLIGILMMAAGGSVRKANEIAKKTKAEAECRELVNALLEYRSVYGTWPGGDNSGEKEASAKFLEPLTDAGKNSRGLVFLNLSLSTGNWNDPWGNPYKIFFPRGSKTERPMAMEACVSFPFRRPPPM